jgi:molecular chaperone GrpE
MQCEKAKGMAEPVENESRAPEEEVAEAAGSAESPTDEPREPDASPPARSTAPAKARILQQFEAWLDEALAEEPLPEGIAPDILSEIERGGLLEEGSPPGKEADLYSLWAGVTALAQEVKLQGRAFKELNDSLSPLLEWVSTSQERAVREAERRARRETIEVLVDLRGRLARGADLAGERLQEARRASVTPWFARFFRGRSAGERETVAVVEALERGYRMNLDRVDEVLDRLGVREIECEGETFDPYRMTAVDVEETLDAEEGDVVEVYRPGYEWDGEVFRAAEVKVARAPRSPGKGGET